MRSAEKYPARIWQVSDCMSLFFFDSENKLLKSLYRTLRWAEIKHY